MVENIFIFILFDTTQLWMGNEIVREIVRYCQLLPYVLMIITACYTTGLINKFNKNKGTPESRKIRAYIGLSIYMILMVILIKFIFWVVEWPLNSLTHTIVCLLYRIMLCLFLDILEKCHHSNRQKQWYWCFFSAYEENVTSKFSRIRKSGDTNGNSGLNVTVFRCWNSK